jgi:hypothetical protein
MKNMVEVTFRESILIKQVFAFFEEDFRGVGSQGITILKEWFLGMIDKNKVREISP